MSFYTATKPHPSPTTLHPHLRLSAPRSLSVLTDMHHTSRTLTCSNRCPPHLFQSSPWRRRNESSGGSFRNRHQIRTTKWTGGQDTRGASSTTREMFRALPLDSKLLRMILLVKPQERIPSSLSAKPSAVFAPSPGQRKRSTIFGRSMTRDQKATSLGTVSICRNVHIVGFTFCNRGLAARLQVLSCSNGQANPLGTV